MADYDIRALQLRILDILVKVDEVCREHDIRYYITAGTALGAYRHQGFLPWDDDIDIGMPRSDYERFMRHSKEWLPKHLEAVCFELDPEYPLPFGKIQDASTTLIERMHLKYIGGIYIDVFPIDGAPATKLKQRLHFAKYEFYKRVLYFIHRDPYKHGHGPSSWLPLLARKFFTPLGVQKRLKDIMTMINFDDSDYVADYDDGLVGIMPHHIYGEPQPLLFEGKRVMGPQNHSVYLRTKYGPDFYVEPPVEKRRQHNFHYLDLNNPYAEYKKKER
jgi:lipopolysaccharide cholinephosphotransferase